MTTDTKHERLTEILERLKHELAQPNTNLLPLLGVIGRFTKYSLHNQLLILAQRPAATDVRGYQAWRQAGYQVKKGEHGIAIYAPMRFRQDESEPLAAEGRLGFRVVHVFDRAQVEPIAWTALVDATPSSVPAALTSLEQWKAWAVGHNLELAYHPLPSGCYGATTGTRILCTTGLDPATEFATLVHETAHVLLHFGADRPESLTVRETEAEGVAYVLCAQRELTAAAQFSVAYIRAYRGSAETLETSLERIRATALRLATELDAIRFAGTP
jgi:hypothetical protein